MAGSVNKVILIGRLGKDPEVRYTKTSTAVTRFSLATDESWTGKDGAKHEATEWHNIVVFGRMGEICAEYLSKGRQVYIEGSLKTREWTGQDGQARRTTEINAREVVFLGDRAQQGEQAPKHPQQTQEGPVKPVAPNKFPEPPDDDDNIPF